MKPVTKYLASLLILFAASPSLAGALTSGQSEASNCVECSLPASNLDRNAADAVKMIWNNRISQGYLADAVKAFGGIILDNRRQQRLKGRRYAFQGQMVAGEEPWKNFWSTIRNGFIPIYPKKPIAMKKKHIIAEQTPELDQD